VWQAAAVSAATPPLFRPQTVGEDEYVDGSFVANNPSMHALQEAINLWKRPIDYLISIGTGFCQTTSKTGDARLSWFNRQVDLVSETLNVVGQVALSCHQSHIFFERLSPEVHLSFLADAISTNELQNLSNSTLQYSNTETTKMKQICQRLIASLLYVSEVIPEGEHEPTKVLIQCRVARFKVPPALGGPKWRLDSVPLKGDTTSAVAVLKNKDNGPFALVTVNQYSANCAVGIQIMLGEDAYPISGGACVDLPMSPLFRNGANPFQHDKPVYTILDVQ
jgi:hypothetical protein